jgi:hypothetical protein
MGDGYNVSSTATILPTTFAVTVAVVQFAGLTRSIDKMRLRTHRSCTLQYISSVGVFAAMVTFPSISNYSVANWKLTFVLFVVTAAPFKDIVT